MLTSLDLVNIDQLVQISPTLANLTTQLNPSNHRASCDVTVTCSARKQGAPRDRKLGQTTSHTKGQKSITTFSTF